ncbi:MAG: Spy/CpxP family protein refolding chaperone [Candidatus Goldbacteria bacterium]|nr:Spy/CpxP family protein refolding chaperone [Candidatus Goldiibacteriota bacterium]
MKRKNLTLFIVFVLFISGFQFIYAEQGNPCKQEKPFMGGPPSEHKLGIDTAGILDFEKELNLTEDQVNKIKEIRDKSRKEIFNLRNEIRTLIWDIQDEMKKKNADKGKINSMIDKISNNQKNLMKKNVEQFFEVKNVLTEEQFEKQKKLFEEKKKSMRNKNFEKSKCNKPMDKATPAK